MDQYQKGLTNVLAAFATALQERQVAGAEVTHDAVEGSRQTVHVSLTVGQKTASQHFEADELEDCGQAIDAPAAFKVRLLVSQFVR